jgi:hypothetical protein
MKVEGQFVNANNLQGINVVNGGNAIFGVGVSICDFDGDGLDDVSLGTTNTPPFLFRNTGSGFEQIPFLHPSPNKSIKSIIWVDIDNDGDRDLFLSYEFDSVRLYENLGDMTLVDITPESGLLMEYDRRNAGASFGDYNNDGYLDLYLCKYYNSGAFQGPTYENILYRNNGDNTFSNVTYEANASVGVNASFNPVWWDYDQDGWLDLYIVNDRVFNQNYLLRNLGNGSFEDVSVQTGVNHFIDAMGCALGDFNNDLLIDFYVANSEVEGNYLYQQQPDNTFIEIGEQAGVRSHKLCWSGLWIDYDNDGWLDLHVGAEINQVNQMAPNDFFRNLGNGSFQNVTQSVGLGNDHFSTFATAAGDWNYDGYPDFISSNAAPAASSLWQSIGGSNNYLAVELEGTHSNRDAIGATIYAYAENLQQVRYVTCSENYIGQNSHRKLFGLGGAETIDSLIIKWPRGLTEKYYNLAVNTTHKFTEGSSLSANVVADQLFFCENNSIELHASVAAAVAWSNGTFAPSIEVLEPGAYWYSYINPFGFTVLSDTVDLVSFPLSSFQFGIEHPSCFGQNDGAIHISNQWASFPVTVLINGIETSLTNENLSSGDYQVTLINQHGCTTSQSFTLLEPEAIQTLLYVNPIECYSDLTDVEIFAFGGAPPYTIDWNGVNPNELTASSYSVTVTDENGCTNTTQFTIDEPAPLQVSVSSENDVLSAEVTGGTPPYTIFWVTPGGSINENNELNADVNGNYVLAVTDDNGCSENLVFPVTVTFVNTLDSQNAYAFPNPTRGNLHLGVTLGQISAVAIFDLTGREVYTTALIPSSEINLDLSFFAAGSYMAFLKTVDGAQLRVRITVAH